VSDVHTCVRFSGATSLLITDFSRNALIARSPAGRLQVISRSSRCSNLAGALAIFPGSGGIGRLTCLLPVRSSITGSVTTGSTVTDTLGSASLKDGIRQEMRDAGCDGRAA